MENSAFEMYGRKRGGKEEDEVSSRIVPKPGVTKQEEIRLAHRFWRNRKNTVPRFSREPSWEETLGYRHGMMYGDVSSSYANKTEAAYRRIRDAKTPVVLVRRTRGTYTERHLCSVLPTGSCVTEQRRCSHGRSNRTGMMCTIYTVEM